MFFLHYDAVLSNGKAKYTLLEESITFPILFLIEE